MKFPFASREKRNLPLDSDSAPTTFPRDKRAFWRPRMHLSLDYPLVAGQQYHPPPPHTHTIPKPSKHIWKRLLPKVKANIYHAICNLRKECLSRCMIWRLLSGGRNLAGPVPAYGHVRSIHSIRVAILCRRNTAVSTGIQNQIIDLVIPLSHILRFVNIILRREICAFTEATGNLYQHTRRRISNDSRNQLPSSEPHTSHTLYSTLVLLHSITCKRPPELASKESYNSPLSPQDM